MSSVNACVAGDKTGEEEGEEEDVEGVEGRCVVVKVSHVRRFGVRGLDGEGGRGVWAWLSWRPWWSSRALSSWDGNGMSTRTKIYILCKMVVHYLWGDELASIGSACPGV
jgi:hypothetical protein